MVYHKGKGAADSRGNLNDSTALRSADTFSKISVSDFGENVNKSFSIPVVFAEKNGRSQWGLYYRNMSRMN